MFGLLPAKTSKVTPADRLDRDKDDRACRCTLALAKTAAGRRAFRAAALCHLNVKANNSHDYKYTAAAFEDVVFISERWRPAFLAAMVHVLHGPASDDAPVFRQAREALARV